jgi:hypothetical protein
MAVSMCLLNTKEEKTFDNALWPLALGVGLFIGKHIVPLWITLTKAYQCENIMGHVTATERLIFHLCLLHSGILSLLAILSSRKMAAWIKVLLIITGHFQLIWAQETIQSSHNEKLEKVTQFKLKYEGYYNVSDIISSTTSPYREHLSIYGTSWFIMLLFGAIHGLQILYA